MTLEEKRIKMHNRFKELLESNEVYYNPPDGKKIKYPCIIYKDKNFDIRYASDKAYKYDRVYQVSLIGSRPIDDLKNKLLLELSYIRFDNSFVSDNLYHYVYTKYE